MSSRSLDTSPPRLFVGDEPVAPQVRWIEEDALWEVTVAISRSGDDSVLQASDLAVELFVADGTPVPLREAPEGPLVEVGGGMGTTANAWFRFGDTEARPTLLVVRYRDARLQFELQPAAADRTAP